MLAVPWIRHRPRHQRGSHRGSVDNRSIRAGRSRFNLCRSSIVANDGIGSGDLASIAKL